MLLRKVINSDEIIEQYPDDNPSPSVLILGRTNHEKSIHVVCAPTDIGLVVITAYNPSSENWELNWKTRKKFKVKK